MLALVCCLLPTAYCLSAAPATAQTDYPKQPIKIIVSLAPGGVADIAARQFAAKMGEAGKTVVVENRTGGGGLIGAGEAAGILDSLLDRLATYKEKILAIKSKIRGALFYPAAILVVAFIVTSVITTRSVKELGLTVGKEVVALVKSTEVSIATL